MNPVQSIVNIVKRSYAAKMLRKYEHVVNKRHRDKRLQLGRKRKEWSLEI